MVSSNKHPYVAHSSRRSGPIRKYPPGYPVNLIILSTCNQATNFLPSFEECNIKQGSIEVNELKYVHFESKRVFIFSVSAMQFYHK